MLLRQKSGGSFAQNSIRHTAWDVLAQFTSFLHTNSPIYLKHLVFPLQFQKTKRDIKTQLVNGWGELGGIFSSGYRLITKFNTFFDALSFGHNTKAGGIILILIGQIDWTYCVWLKRADLNHIHSFDNYKHPNSFESNCQSSRKYSGIKDIWAQSAR